MRHLTTTLLAFAAVLTASAQTPRPSSVTIWEDSDPEMANWKTIEMTNNEIPNLKYGDKFSFTITEVSQSVDWPQIGLENGEYKVYPEELKLHDYKNAGISAESPRTFSYTLTEDDVNNFKNGFDIKVNGARLSKIEYTQCTYDFDFVSELLFNDHTHAMMNWNNEIEIPQTALQNIELSPTEDQPIRVGAKFLIAINSVQEDKEYCQIGFETTDAGDDDSKKFYPQSLKNCENLETPCLEEIMVTEENMHIFKNGFVIKGDGVQVTSLTLMRNVKSIDLSKAQFITVWKGDSPETLDWSKNHCWVPKENIWAIKENDMVYVYLTDIDRSKNYIKMVLTNREEEGDDKNDSKIMEIQYGTADMQGNTDVNSGADANAPRRTVTTTPAPKDRYVSVLKFLVNKGNRDKFANGFYLLGDNMTVGKIDVRRDPKNGLVTGIENVTEPDSDTVDVYNMQGMCVRRGVKAEDAATGLPAGIYVAGGHKFIVR